jgi:hypothetical protein
MIIVKCQEHCIYACGGGSGVIENNVIESCNIAIFWLVTRMETVVKEGEIWERSPEFKVLSKNLF